jgi:hypothetical protein
MLLTIAVLNKLLKIYDHAKDLVEKQRKSQMERAIKFGPRTLKDLSNEFFNSVFTPAIIESFDVKPFTSGALSEAAVVTFKFKEQANAPSSIVVKGAHPFKEQRELSYLLY